MKFSFSLWACIVKFCLLLCCIWGAWGLLLATPREPFGYSWSLEFLNGIWAFSHPQFIFCEAKGMWRLIEPYQLVLETTPGSVFEGIPGSLWGNHMVPSIQLELTTCKASTLYSILVLSLWSQFFLFFFKLKERKEKYFVSGRGWEG